MKVYIITEGGKNIGFGHITRCLSLYQVFEERGIRPEFIAHGDNTVDDLLKDKNCQIFNWFEQKSKLFESIENADIVIIDSYLADISFYEDLSNAVAIPVYIDDNRRLDYPRGIVANGNIHAEELGYPKKDKMIYLLGTQYVLLRKEFWTVREKEIKDKLSSVMITFGGNDSTNMTPKILRFLKQNYPGLKKYLIIGKAFQHTDEIEQEAGNNTNLIYNPSAEKMKSVMLESDIAISAGGQTLYELARVGTPTIGIAVAANQLYNLEGWGKAGFIEYAGWHNEENFWGKLKNSMKKLEVANSRRSKFEIGRQFVDGKGSLRIVNSFKKTL